MGQYKAPSPPALPPLLQIIMGPSSIATLPPNIILASLGVDIHQTVQQNPVQYRKIRYGMDSYRPFGI